MKIRSLLLGSVAAAGLATTGFAADLGVVTSLDVCDELGLSGLTISSDENCLVITGEVKYEFSVGDYDTDINGVVYVNNEIVTDSIEYMGPTGGDLDADSSVTAWLKFVATADSDFGPASATIKLLLDGEEDDDLGDNLIGVDEAYVSIGDTTMIMAGKKGSIFENGEDAPLNWLGLFNSEMVDAGVGGDGVETGGHVIQIVHNLGNGLSIGGGLEDLDEPTDDITGVGVLKYAGDDLSAHVSFAVADLGDSGGADEWMVHAGVSGTMDAFKFVGAIYADNTTSATTYWNALGSVSATFDIFTIAVSAEADGDGTDQQWGVGGSLGAEVTEGVTLNVGGRYWVEADGDEVSHGAVGLSAAVTETLTATAEVGIYNDTDVPGSFFYGKGGLAWAPGGGFTSSIAGEANSEGAYKATFKAAKTIK
jgi:hypothetical protein